jgi:hypothetical protein
VVELPIPKRAANPGQISFSKLRNAYVLFGSTAPPAYSNPFGTWPRDINQPIYLLSTDGKLSLGGEIPWHEKYRAALGVYFTVKGMVYAGGIEPDDKGFFLVRDGKATLILRAFGPLAIRAGGVSPDGCKVAAAISTDGGSESGGLKLIDLCKGHKR